MFEVLNQDHRNPVRQDARNDQGFDRRSFDYSESEIRLWVSQAKMNRSVL